MDNQTTTDVMHLAVNDDVHTTERFLDNITATSLSGNETHVFSMQLPPYWLHYYHVTFLSVAIIVGVPGNALVMAAYGVLKSRTACDWYIIYIAALDLAVCVFRVPTHLAMETGLWRILGTDGLCKFVMLLSQGVITVSVLLFAFIAVDRYIKVCWHGVQLTSRLSRNILLSITVVGFFSAVPSFWIYAQSQQGTCGLQNSLLSRTMVKWYYTVVFVAFLIMFLIVVVCYAAILIKVRHSQKAMMKHTRRKPPSSTGNSRLFLTTSFSDGFSRRTRPAGPRESSVCDDNSDASGSNRCKAKDSAGSQTQPKGAFPTTKRCRTRCIRVSPAELSEPSTSEVLEGSSSVTRLDVEGLKTITTEDAGGGILLKPTASGIGLTKEDRHLKPDNRAVSYRQRYGSAEELHAAKLVFGKSEVVDTVSVSAEKWAWSPTTPPEESLAGRDGLACWQQSLAEELRNPDKARLSLEPEGKDRGPKQNRGVSSAAAGSGRMIAKLNLTGNNSLDGSARPQWDEKGSRVGPSASGEEERRRGRGRFSRSQHLAFLFLLVTAVFVVSWIPPYTATVWYFYVGYAFPMSPAEIALQMYGPTTYVLNSFTNPIIYVIFNRSFRQSLVHLWTLLSSRRCP